MIDKNKLSKDVEEQIQSLASDVYIQVEEKLTQLISTAVKAEMGKNTDQKNQELSDKEQSLQKDFVTKQKLQATELTELQKKVSDLESDKETDKQNFQVELTQNSINYTETIENLEKQLTNVKQQNTQKQGEKQNNDQKLEEKLLEAEQKLNDRSQEVDGLNGRIMVLTEQEQSLTVALNQANEQAQSASTMQTNSLNEAKKKITDSAQLQIDAITEKLTLAQNEVSNAKTEALQSADKSVQELQQKTIQLTEQIKQEQNGKAELQQQLSALEKTLDTEQDKNKQQDQIQQDALNKFNEQVEQQKVAHQADIAKLNEQTEVSQKAHQEVIAKFNEQAEQQNRDHQIVIVKLNEQAEQKNKDHQLDIAAINEKIESENKRHLDEVQVIKLGNEEAKNLQETAQDAIIELEKANTQLSQKVETEQNDVKLYQQEVAVLNEQLKVAQDGQENILQRFNSNRDKQEIENNKVRETIKFLRDENHQLISDNNEQKTQFTDQIHELEHKLTEYRLKFEYAQKQLAN